MNLTALREKIKNITDYSPDLQQFNDQLDEIVNDSLYAIWTMKRWTFATKTLNYRLYPDILPDRDNQNVVAPATSVGITWVQGERSVGFQFPIDRLQQVGDLDARLVWEGQPIEIENRDYIIVKIVSGTQVLVDEPIVAPTPTAGTFKTKWAIKKRTYDLPEDCIELLYFGHRDYPYNTSAGSFPPYGKATGLMARREEQVDLRADYKASYAEAYVWMPAYQVPAAEKLKLSVANDIGTGFLQGTSYELCWAFEKDGKVGALSEPQVITMTPQGGNNNAITMQFNSWDDETIQADPYNNADIRPTPWRGHRKVIFYNKNFDKVSGERKGLPCWVQIINGGLTRNTDTYNKPVVVNDESNTYTIGNYNQLENGQKRYLEIDGQHQQIRPYPRPDGFDEEVKQVKNEQAIETFQDFRRDAIIRYYKKPQDLVLYTDSPEMPYEFHQLIVFKALEDIYLKMGQEGLSNTYRKRIETEVKDLQKRYCDHIDSQVQRGQFGVNRRGPLYDYQSLRRLN
jgi:hypothetical protein